MTVGMVIVNPPAWLVDPRPSIDMIVPKFYRIPVINYLNCRRLRAVTHRVCHNCTTT